MTAPERPAGALAATIEIRQNGEDSARTELAKRIVPIQLDTGERPDQVFAILADGRLAVWGGTSWSPFPLICGVPLRSLAFDKDGLLWCVSDRGKIVTVKADGNGGTVIDRPWTLKMVTFDGAGTLWAVGQAGNLASWDDSKHEWIIKDQPWELKMIAYDARQALWCVGEAGNTGKWENGTWVVQEIRWNNQWMAFMDL